MPAITRVLVANRGEIARRVFRTCRALGLDTVAVYSEADAAAPHVADADLSVCIGPAEAARSYLNVDAILEAARRAGADAIHPGYGFLAENASFARACADAGIVFIGPTPTSIDAMGSKQMARSLAVEVGVPVVPGYDGEDVSPDRLAAEAERIGYPVLIKASAGGGGKGMQVVDCAEDLEAAVASARRLAASAFGDDTILLEKYIRGPRHVEIQILGDRFGEVVHLCERECSIQRRYQKVIEESPSPLVTPDLRSEMGAAAVRLAKHIGYENAGTVEFIVDEQRNYYFLEVNTRLQVEHPVTECVVGRDLVADQIRIAMGQPLGFTQDDVEQRGYAMECRVYAEDPANEFMPSTGVLLDWHIEAAPWLRVDSGVESGTTISPWYDPMLAKIIVHGPDRATVFARMRRALRSLSAVGVRTNVRYLLGVLSDSGFAAGDYTVPFARMAGDWDPGPSDDIVRRAGMAWVLASFADRAASQRLAPAVRPGFRNNRGADPTVSLTVANRETLVSWQPMSADTLQVAAGFDEDQPLAPSASVRIVDWTPPTLCWVDPDGVRRTTRVVRVACDGEFRGGVRDLDGSIAVVEAPRFAVAEAEVPAGAAVAPMPGTVVAVAVAVGDPVDAGTVVAIVEAMKMEHSLVAAAPGRVVEIRCAVGDTVDEGEIIVVIDTDDEAGVDD
jgi:acetyl-CoA carboxylase biotin carboxylase subunit